MTINPESTGPAADVAPDSKHDENFRRKVAQPPVTDTTARKETPKSILALFEFAYREPGRKLNLTRKALDDIPLQPNAAQDEVDAVRRLVQTDPFLNVPPNVLAAVAELGAERRVRERILDLVLEAMDNHSVFKNRIRPWMEAQTQAPTQQVIEAVKEAKFNELGLQKPSDLTEATRERLRVNAVTTVALMSVLRGMPLDHFIDDMSTHIWKKHMDRNEARAAAVLSAAKNTDALHYLSQRFTTRVQDSDAGRERATIQAREYELRAIRAEALGKQRLSDLDSERTRSARLEAEIDDLKRRLAAEQSSRIVDRSHHVDDYEILRTQVIRRLTNQVELLNDGLHALRNGSTDVAEEFVDRALNAIGGEVKRLKEIDGV
ncbi:MULTISPECIES: hypothetical protein [Paenarthrobacter]|uniref:hypothetical protein n=1 Tax=Paenarthrobacter TaxID=1742992 RepID=UPI001FB246F3|nr:MULTISPECIES: hypothetical protein [Paenarthrobacter]MCW3767780.1 hypothetical protein [Paenarthrobacter sp. PAE-2]UOD83410.1 hypothetical protein MQZ73_19960 [Paenarthrobacter ureafaciens]WNZ05102.1 hypothetical protein PVT25_06090 [Paenarthrobacter ureafaciens]WOC63283.1 hypothetical protein RI444_22320 [Paenarthrobacter sp. AT5]